ncbi:type IVB secretion system protein IcmH/DotU [Acerihabitans arboris]|uniref:OmpA family protein n=1 Tax=Acerihabitans arboris TaxID=2691583 RepID=A0A845SPD5_9GAMM|nr:type IVB secretion system protein IcmH/DotU [Acerihabitans arboris]NDL64388.1 OmpA family protein [Acerihabitans arboris]
MISRDRLRAAQPNQLLAAACPLLNAVAHFRLAPPPADAGALRLQMINEVRRFEQVCREDGQDYNVVIGARYCLCTSLDEAVALTDWGKSSIWAGNGLLVAFHNETNGGEKFFQLMATLLQQPQAHIDLLEVIYFCLLLGFGGRYRVMENGIYRLEILTQRLAQQIRGARGDYARSLGGPCPRRSAPRRPSRARLALPLCFLLCCILLCFLYIDLNSRLDAAAGRVQNMLFSLPLPKPSSPVGEFSLAELMQALAEDIAVSRVAVALQDERATITLLGGDLFASASARLDASYQPAIRLIARHLAFTTGAVTVRGHSDNQRIHGAAFTSNHALALARAETVARILRPALHQPGRVTVESAAGQAPLVPNTTPENRAINRRIDIIFTLAAAKSDSE